MPANISFSDDELAKFDKIMQIYPQIKSLIAYSENIGDGSTYVPLLGDMRKCSDHLMNLYAIKLGQLNSDPNIELDKAVSDLQKVGINVLDYLTICQKEQLDSAITGISPEIVRTICPYIRDELYPQIYELQDIVERMKSNSLEFEQNFLNCFDKIQTIKLKLISVERSKNDMLGEEESNRKEKSKQKEESSRRDLITFGIIALATIIGGIIGGILVYYLTTGKVI